MIATPPVPPPWAHPAPRWTGFVASLRPLLVLPAAPVPRSGTPARGAARPPTMLTDRRRRPRTSRTFVFCAFIGACRCLCRTTGGTDYCPGHRCGHPSLLQVARLTRRVRFGAPRLMAGTSCITHVARLTRECAFAHLGRCPALSLRGLSNPVRFVHGANGWTPSFLLVFRPRRQRGLLLRAIDGYSPQGVYPYT